MDEFFNFEDATHPDSSDYCFGNLPTDGYDIDLALQEPECDERAFNSLQHYGDVTAEQQLSFEFQNDPNDVSTMGSNGYTHFPEWSEAVEQSSSPCEQCQRMRIPCKVINEGLRKGSCASCVASARSCSLVSSERAPGNFTDESWKFGQGFSSSAAIHSNHGSSEDLGLISRNASAQDLGALMSSTENLTKEPEMAPKVGARFSRAALRVLRTWLSTHHRHPYPTDEEKEVLQRETGLNKLQITNWLANARRRGKVRAPRSVSPSPKQFSRGMDIPRRATPALREMDPMERWKHSPPEHEPASVTAIAKAVSSSTFSSGRDSPWSRSNIHTDESDRSLYNASSASSLGTSHNSGGSFASAFSHKSRGSFGSIPSMGNRGRRRRRRQVPNPVKIGNTQAPPRTFQCTFCTETFKTKHDWQRHEKSLHLSLERWVCSPNGPSSWCAEFNHLSCVYCALPNPPDGHAEVHNHSSCAEKSLEERTFYRKDHLRQHLHLVHGVKFQSWTMDEWKVATPEIRSRCGFCGVVMNTWSMRVDHLAEHFKAGKNMADWKGDWGFEPEILDLVENGMPPYLIHDERNTMRPYEATRPHPEMQQTLEDEVKGGLVDFINERVISGSTPTDEDLLAEARQIIRKSDAISTVPRGEHLSWFRDLILYSGSSPEKMPEEEPILATQETSSIMTWADKMERKQASSFQMTDLNQISCFKERAMLAYVKTRTAIGLTPTDSELQVQACKILDEVEATSTYKCKGGVQWFKYLITASPDWLTEFRRRALLPRSDEMALEGVRPLDKSKIDYSIHNYHRLERELIEFVNYKRAMGETPTDADLQRQARLTIFENDDQWNQTAADDPNYLRVFKRRNGLLAPIDEEDEDLPEVSAVGELALSLLSAPTDTSAFSSTSHSSPSPRTLHWDLEDNGTGLPSPLSGSDRNGLHAQRPHHNTSPKMQNQPSHNPTLPVRYFLNDVNCYNRLARELTRFVTTCTSPNNPLQHVPSDAEIQNQARWVIFDDDDPWNQTAADNAEWLMRFKRDVGLLPPSSGPGLPGTLLSWQVSSGGSGFSPPYAMPSKDANFVPAGEVSMFDKSFPVRSETVGHYVQGLGERYQPAATIFCSRDLESGLSVFVRDSMAEGHVPTDEELRAKARSILGIEQTAADDDELLQKFRAMHGIADGAQPSLSPGGPLPDYSLPNFTDDVAMLANFDMDLGPMDLTTELGAGVMSSTSPMEGFDMMGQDAFDPMPQTGANVTPVGNIQEYADVHRVHAATASPLRRRASERLASSTAWPRANVLPDLVAERTGSSRHVFDDALPTSEIPGKGKVPLSKSEILRMGGHTRRYVKTDGRVIKRVLLASGVVEVDLEEDGDAAGESGASI